MIPILYESTESSFTTNGFGRLSDAIECTVTEERNGGYELFMRYPVKGAHFVDVSLDRLIYATHDDAKVPQAFRIYKVSKPLNGIVSVYAEHISYQLNRMIVMPFDAQSCAGTLAGIEQNVAGGMDGFTLWTDKSVVKRFELKEPQSVRSILSGQSGSILDVYGTGEYEFDMRTVKLYVNRGRDNGVILRYGKNITNITADADMTNVYTAIVPYWTNGEEMVTLPEKIVYAEDQYANRYAEKMAKPVDFSSEIKEKPSPATLRSRAQAYLADNEGWNINQNVKVDFVQLWQTEEYAQYAPLQRVRLCDTVKVIYEPLGIEATAKVVKTTYNVLLDRYDEIEVGEAQSNMTGAVADVTKDVTKEYPTKSFLQKSIERATEMITGGLGGYVKFNYNADGEMEEIVIMDTPDIATAMNVWRWNKNGLGYSSTGYDGEYRLAITADGHIVADFIDTGFLSASRIRAGILTALQGKCQFDVDAGELIIKVVKFLATSSVVGGFVPVKISGGGIEFYNTAGNKSHHLHDYGMMDIYNDSDFRIQFLPRDGGAGDFHWSGLGIAYNLISTHGNLLFDIYHTGNQKIQIRDFDTGAGFIFQGNDDTLYVIDTNNIIYTAQTGEYWVTNSSGDPASFRFVNGILIGTTGF